MESLIQCNYAEKKVGEEIFFTTNIVDLHKKWKLMANHGLYAIPSLNCYVKEGLGAWMGNVDKNIKSINELKANGYAEEISKGYELVLGEGAPACNGVVYGKGVYCKNYLQLMSMQEEKAKSR